MADQTTTLAKVDAFRAEVAAIGAAPPPPPTGTDIVGTLVKTDTNAPKTTPADQPFVLALHASGGPQVTFGQQWQATVAEPYRHTSMKTTWAMQGNANAISGIYLQPHDRVYKADGVTTFESYWLGYAIGTDLRLYTHRILDELYAMETKRVGVSATKRVAAGGSMGAWGCMTYALRRPDKFAAIFASRPRWRWDGKAVQTVNGGPIYVDSALTINGAPAAPQLDAIAYVSNPANKAPYIVWCVGRRDNYTAFSEHIEAVRALRATGRGFAFAWNDGDHSSGDNLAAVGPMATAYGQFALGVGYPILTNCSHDKDPAVDLVGTINAGFQWRNVVESPTAWSCEITNTQNTTVDVKPYSEKFTATVASKTISITAGVFVAVSFASASQPPPPPSSSLVPIITRVVNRPKAIIMGAEMPDLSGHKLFVGFSDGGRYVRGQEALELAGQTVTAPLAVGPTITVRGIIETTAAPQLTWGVAWNASVTFTPPASSGKPVITISPQPVEATATDFRVAVDRASIPEGPYFLGVTGAPPGWGVLEYPVYVRHTVIAGQQQTLMGVCVGSYTHMQAKTDGQLHWAGAFVPAKYDPVMVSLQPRTYPQVQPIAPIVTGVAMTEMAKLAYTMVVPLKEDDVYRAAMLPSGVWTTAHGQNYGFASFYEKPLPTWLVLAGPRGKATMVCPTSLQLTTRTDTPGKILFTQPHNVGTVNEEGSVHIEWGYYHAEPPPYAPWDFFRQQRPPAPLQFAGGWDASVPGARRVVQELWDVAVDATTVAVDENSPMIGDPPQHSHVVDVRKFIVETAAARTTFGGRVLRLQYGKADLARTGVATEFVNYAVGTKPWGCALYGRLLLVTLVGPKAVEVRDADTGALVRMVPSPNGHQVNGIRVHGDTAYVGTFSPSPLQGAVWKLDLLTWTWTKFFDCLVNGNSLFVNVAVGYLGGQLCVAYVTWSNNTYGWPAVHGPDGKRLPIGAPNNSWGSAKGTFTPPGLSYAGAVALGHANAEQMVWGTVQDGLHRVSAALPTDLPVPAACFLGYQEYWERNLHLTNQDYGFGQCGAPMPWGVTPNIDALLLNQGHTRGA